MPKRLSDISFLELLPESISGDQTVRDAARSLDGEIQAVNDLLEVPAILSRLDELSERAVDYLAWQFHVDAWDPDMALSAKRELVRTSIAWHRYLGTPYAVKSVVEAIMGPTEIVEWPSWGGDPYLFRVYVSLENRGVSEDEYDRGLAAIQATKNVRSHLDLLRIHLVNRSMVPRLGSTGLSAETVTIEPYQVTLLEQSAAVPKRAMGGHFIDTTSLYPQ